GGGRRFVKLFDFGIAKVNSPLAGRRTASITESGTIVGTPQYMSPEQAQGHSEEIDARSDLYMVGVILFEILCGRLPFEQETAGDLVIAHALTPPPSASLINPAISAPLAAVIKSALEKRREDRYQSACEMAEALFRALEAAPPPALPAPSPRPAPPPRRWIPWIAFAIGFALGACLVFQLPSRPSARDLTPAPS